VIKKKAADYRDERNEEGDRRVHSQNTGVRARKGNAILSVSSASSPLRQPVTIGFPFVSHDISLKVSHFFSRIKPKQRRAVASGAFPVSRH